MKRNYAEKLQRQLEESFLFTPFLGVNVTIYDEKLGHWSTACGYEEPKTKKYLENDRLFYIYSITKTFTAVIILKLIESGKLSLNEYLHRLLPDLTIAEPITLRQLLNHTSGLPNYTELEDYEPSVIANPSQPWEEKRIIELVQTRRLDFQPGQGWHYSNTGYFVLKKAIEKYSNLSYAEAIEKYIIKPLGLSDTFVVEDIPCPRLTPGYSRDLHPDKRMENVKGKYHPGWCYTGLVASSTENTVEFYHELFTGHLLPKALVDELSQPISTGQKDPRFGDPCYGLGVMIDTHSKYGLLIGHAGAGPGYNPWVMHLPNFCGRALTIAVFANTGFGIIPMLLVDDLLAQLAIA